MSSKKRLKQIVEIVGRRGFVSVRELSELLHVSEVTIRRDLQRLDGAKKVQRTYGGAIAVRIGAEDQTPERALASKANGIFWDDHFDVIVTTAIGPRFNRILLEKAATLGIPIVAESLGADDMVTVVAVDNFAAARDLGRWVGRHASEHFAGKASVLDLTHGLPNTTDRSAGFLAGLQDELSDVAFRLSINAQAREHIAYQLTRDALSVHPDINIIFSINDITAQGALRACKDMNVDPQNMALVTFGLEGDIMKDALMEEDLCKAGLAMFPEIVGPMCIKAAICAHNKEEMPAELLTPHAVLTSQSLGDFYHKEGGSWHFIPSAAQEKPSVAFKMEACVASCETLPHRLGFILSYSKHEWYQNLRHSMLAYAKSVGIEFEVIDPAESLRDELALRMRGIARLAASLVKPGDVVIIDGGQVTTFLAEELASRRDITVITNSLPVFDTLRSNTEMTLISTGGVVRQASQTQIGPTTESVLRELRGDKLFLAICGVSSDFGLFHTNLAEVTVKQAMIQAVREVILLADHTKFYEEAMIQVAPIGVVDKLITDNALPASIRLNLTKLGVEIMLARS